MFYSCEHYKESQMRHQIAQAVIEDSHNYLKLVGFEKSKSFSMIRDGREYFTIHYTATVEATGSNVWAASSSAEELLGPWVFDSEDQARNLTNQAPVQLKEGQKYRYTTSSTFIKFNEGWEKIY